MCRKDLLEEEAEEIYVATSVRTTTGAKPDGQVQNAQHGKRVLPCSSIPNAAPIPFTDI